MQEYEDMNTATVSSNDSNQPWTLKLKVYVGGPLCNWEFPKLASMKNVLFITG